MKNSKYSLEDRKKAPHANLENYSKIFMQVGIVLALFIVYLAITHRTIPSKIDVLTGTTINMEDEEKLVEIKVEQPIIPKQAPVALPDKIEVVKDEVEVIETIIESTEVDEDDAVIVQIDEMEIESEEEEIIEDVPFAIIEDVPVYPGCKGNKAKLRACLQERITKHVNKKFNAELAADLGLSPGTNKIFVMFKIDKNGNISNIQARAPHKRLQEEAIRVVKLLPKMTPGKQRGVPVGVKYSLPIVFRVE